MFHQHQMQQINEQMIEQMQVNAKCNEILFSLLEALEYYAYRISGHSNNNIIFGGYNDGDNLNKKDLKNLRYYIIAKIELFKFSYKNYINQYGKYDFPNYLSKNEIFNFLTIWKRMIPESNQRIFYDAPIEIINGNLNISTDALIKMFD